MYNILYFPYKTFFISDSEDVSKINAENVGSFIRK